MSFDLSQEQPEGTLRGFRALLGFARPIKLAFYPVRALSFFALVVILVLVSVDSGIYNGSNPLKMDMQADKAPWVVYGTNIACLLCLFYFFARCVLAYAPKQFYDDTTHAPEDLPRFWGGSVWALYLVANPAIWTSLILYEEFGRDLTTYRGTQEGTYITVFVIMLVNMLLSNTPILLRHGAIWVTLLAAYMAGLFVFEAISGLQVYPFTSTLQPLLVVVFGGIVYVALHAIWIAREALLLYATAQDSVVWYKPTSAEEIKALEEILATTGA